MILANIPFLFMFFNFGFILLVLGITIALFVSIFINFKRSMLSKPAYLTLTLPVSTTELILSKVIMSIMWLIIGIGILVIEFFVMSVVTGCINDSITITEIMNSLVDIFKGIGYALTHCLSDVLSSMFSVLSGLILIVGSIYFSLTATHTKILRKHRLIFGIILYVALNIVVGYIGDMIFGNSTLFFSYLEDYSLLESIYYLLVGSLLIVGTIYIFDHHIEIE